MQTASLPPADTPDETSEIRRVTAWGLVVNVLLSGLKFVAGWLGNSQAIIADAVHSLSDTASDVAILVGSRYWSQPADAKHPYGHRRIETLIVAGLGLILAAVAIGLIWNATESIHNVLHAHTEPTRPGPIAFFGAIASILVKEWLYRWTAKVGRNLKSSALIANAWHHRSDAFSSIPASLAIAGTWISPNWAFLDPVGAILVAALILKAAWSIAQPALAKLIDSGVPEAIQSRILAAVNATPGVEDVHALRTRYIGCNSIVVDCHILVEDTLSVLEGHNIATAVKHRVIAEVEDVLDVLVHTEPFHRHPDREPPASRVDSNPPATV